MLLQNFNRNFVGENIFNGTISDACHIISLRNMEKTQKILYFCIFHEILFYSNQKIMT